MSTESNRDHLKLVDHLKADAEYARIWVAWHSQPEVHHQVSPGIGQYLRLAFLVASDRADNTPGLEVVERFADWCDSEAHAVSRNPHPDLGSITLAWRVESQRCGLRTIPALDMALIALVVLMAAGVGLTVGGGALNGLLMLLASASLFLYLKTAAPTLAVGPDAPGTRFRRLMARDLLRPGQRGTGAWS